MLESIVTFRQIGTLAIITTAYDVIDERHVSTQIYRGGRTISDAHLSISIEEDLQYTEQVGRDLTREAIQAYRSR